LSAVESRPIEIKPLFHYWPNSTALTFSNWGCNFYCPWCQNHHISFRKPDERDEVTPPERLLELASVRGMRVSRLVSTSLQPTSTTWRT